MHPIRQVIQAEMLKQHRNWFHSGLIYFSLLIWPILTFFVAYFNYKPFDLQSSSIALFETEESVLLFLITGYIGWICFWSLMQSAWQMGFERQNGTLETVFLSPANRPALMYGRALGALFENIWMFLVFSVAVTFWIKGIPLSGVIFLPISLMVIFISAVVWGGFLNVMFLFSRDAGFLYDICDEPMTLFSGVTIPPTVFPLWAKVISVIFPLTHALFVSRNLLIPKTTTVFYAGVIELMSSLGLLIILTLVLLKYAERHARRSGNLTFF